MTTRSRSPTSPRSEPEISDDGKTITFTISEGVRYSPPVDREVRPPTSSTRSSGAPARRRQRLHRRRIWATSRASPRREKAVEKDPTGGARDQRDQGARRPHAGHRARPSRPRGRCSVALAAARRAGAGGVREGVRRREPLDLRRARWSATGPYMIENDAEGELTGYKPGQGDRPGPQPELGRRRPTSARPIWTRSTVQEGFTDVDSATRRILDRRRAGERRHPARAAGSEAGRAPEYPDQLDADADAAATATSR